MRHARERLAWRRSNATGDRLRVAMLASIAPARSAAAGRTLVADRFHPHRGDRGARGVELTLFATDDSTTRARLVAVAPRGYAEDPSLDAKVYECLHVRVLVTNFIDG
jgi:hypothetical protein